MCPDTGHTGIQLFDERLSGASECAQTRVTQLFDERLSGAPGRTQPETICGFVSIYFIFSTVRMKE